MSDFQNNTKKDLEPILDHLNQEISVLHSSRATPALVENIQVDAYGSKLPIKEVASLATPDARTIVVQPWDPTMLGPLQTAIELSKLGMGMSVDEKFIRLTMPQLSEERRRETIKVLGKKVEESRIAVRRIRDKVVKSIEDAEKSKEISEDVKSREKDAVQKIINECNKKIAGIEEHKAKEIETS
ncbi:MAG: ribosome-recycling factor [bacterium]|nr:ribosome-recycling factor [bacterium]